jgi:hypothetical protein
MFSRWIVTNITSASVTTFLAFLAGIISWSVYCTSPVHMAGFSLGIPEGTIDFMDINVAGSEIILTDC